MDHIEDQEEQEDRDQVEQFIIHWNEYMLFAFVGIPDVELRRLIEAEPLEPLEPINPVIQTIGTVHYLEQEESQGPSKRHAPSIKTLKRITRHQYLKLLSHEYHFDDDEGKDIILTPTMEPNLYIRKLIGRIPKSIRGRLTFLAQFANEADNQVLAVDEIETSEWIYPTEPLINTIFTDLKEQLYTAYLTEMRLRRAFRNVLQRWRIYRIHKKEQQTQEITDPITLTEPKKLVTVYDMAVKTRYQFDATSLATWIESNLKYSEGGFAIPMNPRNPWTNVEFTYPQLVSIYNQLKEHGELRWGFTTFRKHQFHKVEWQRYHSSALTLGAIRNSLTHLDSPASCELLEDFIFSRMDELDIDTNSYIDRAYQKAMIQCPHHWYLEEFKAVAFKYYEAKHLGQNRHRVIHTRCDRIFRKQNQFIDDLIRLGIISGPSS